MLNHERSHPEYFEELCALAASGQISEGAFVELQDHLQQCADCRSAYADFIDLLHNKLPLVDPELMGSSKRAGFFLRILHTANGFSRGRADRVSPFHTALCPNAWEQIENLVAARTGLLSGCCAGNCLVARDRRNPRLQLTPR